LKKEDLVIITHTDEETIRLGRKLGSLLTQGDVVALTGELGSGKTWFSKGIALGLDVPADTVVVSPTFSLVNAYQGRCPFFHMDIYRLGELSDFLSTGLEEYLYEDGVTVMEWADRWPYVLPEWKIAVRIIILDDFSREFTFSGAHGRAAGILAEMEKSRLQFPVDDFH
jgi:tRNA threonylcarbamoyladenosine biosynthesis protein TsaE